MTKKRHKIGIFVSVVLVVTLLFSMTAFASWYGWSSATFSTSLTGQWRKYDGNNVGLNWGSNTHNSMPNHVNNSAGFNISLQRRGFLGTWSTVGTYKASRKGAGSATWTNVGSGTYRFYFSKANDGTTEYVTDIEMYSW